MIRIGTRSSPLALAQANAVAEALRAQGTNVQVLPMRTEGDHLAETRLAAVGGKGLFVRDIELALLAGEIELGVHSLKDLPAEVPRGLALLAYPPREDPRDVLITRVPGGLDGLPAGAVVGTSSPRRRSLVLAARGDLAVEPIRGNVETRLRKLESGAFDAVVLAAAGLRRLGLTLPDAEALDPEVFVPAVGQGIIAVEARSDDPEMRRWLEAVDDAPTRVCATAERAYLARLGASCVTPMAAHARLHAGTLHVNAVVASEDGGRVLRASASGDPAQAATVGRAVAEALLAQGAATITALQPTERPT